MKKLQSNDFTMSNKSVFLCVFDTWEEALWCYTSYIYNRPYKTWIGSHGYYVESEQYVTVFYSISDTRFSICCNRSKIKYCVNATKEQRERYKHIVPWQLPEGAMEFDSMEEFVDFAEKEFPE